MFSEEQVFQTFLLSNPGLRETAVLNGPEGVILFIRIEGFRPRTTTLPFCKWLGEAATVRLCLRRKFTATYKWLNNCTPLALSFSEIVWPDGIRRRFALESLEFTYHAPFGRDSRGKTNVNYPYWSARFALARLVKYCPGSDRFYVYDDEAKEWAETSLAYVKSELLHFLLQEAIRTGCEALEPCTEKQLNDLVKSLRVVAIGDEEGGDEALSAFVTECLEGHAGSDVTVEELFSAFEGFCARRRQQRLTKAQFFDKSAPMIQRRFSIGRSNSVTRNGRARRGYYNLRLKLVVHTVTGEVLGTAGTAGTG
jgi:hypothetical protein